MRAAHVSVGVRAALGQPRWSKSLLAGALQTPWRYACQAEVEAASLEGGFGVTAHTSDRGGPTVEAKTAAPNPAGKHPPLIARLLPYVYRVDDNATTAKLRLPVDRVSLRRLRLLVNAEDTESLRKTLQNTTLQTSPEACTHLLNSFVAYMRHLRKQTDDAASSRPQVRTPDGLHLRGDEQHVLLQVVCDIVEQRRVPIVVASRLLRFRWPHSLYAKGGHVSQKYLTDLIRSWATEELHRKTLSPRDARALLDNCAFALRHSVQAQAQQRRKKGGSKAPDAVASFIGALAAVAVEDVQSPKQAEGLINLMWAIHSTGCPAPLSFWNSIIGRVVGMNEALGGELENSTGDAAETPTGTPVPSPRRHHHHAGHFFSSLTTRQLFRFLMVLKKVRWSSDATVLHQLADQAIRNISFELEAANYARRDSQSRVDAASKVPPMVSLKTTIDPFSGVPAKEADLRMLPLKPVRVTKSELVRRIQLVADVQPAEFLELLTVAGELGVSFGASSPRITEELLTPLVNHLNGEQLSTFLSMVRRTHSQSVALLQAVVDRLTARGSTAPYARSLAMRTVKTAATAPMIFQAIQLDAFSSYFLDVCEAQHTLVRASEVASMAEALYLVSRRYEETSPLGQRLRAVVSLLCGQVDRLLQLGIAPDVIPERILEKTVMLRMRSGEARYAAVQDLLASRAVALRQEEARREELAKRALDHVQNRTGVSEGDGEPSKPLPRGPRWELLSEKELPQVSKAALLVYRELVYMFERMVVTRASMSSKDFKRFEESFSKAGLYSVLRGGQLFQQGHLLALPDYTAASAQAAGQQLQRVLPSWIEKKVTECVLRKLATSGVSAASSDDDVLHVLGHVHCDAAKLDALVELIVSSPFCLLKRQQPLWLYVGELARRFGSASTKAAIESYLKSSFY